MSVKNSNSGLLSAVLLTLVYTDQFLYPLTTQQVEERLIGHANDRAGERTKSKGRTNTHDTQRSKIISALKQLQQLGLVRRVSDFWQVRTALNDKRDVSEQRLRREQLAQMKWQKVRSFVSMVSWVPWVQAVAVTGSLAMNAPSSYSDIDFMILTKQHRLWLARLVVSGLAIVHGRRRAVDVETPNSWCCNLWLDSENLAVPFTQRTLYTAYEVCQARFVFDRQQWERQFLFRNQWARLYLPRYVESRLNETRSDQAATFSFNPTPRVRVVLEYLDQLLDFFWRGANGLAYIVQRIYMTRHMTRELVSLHHAYFHPRDTKQIIITRCQQTLQSLT